MVVNTQPVYELYSYTLNCICMELKTTRSIYLVRVYMHVAIYS